MVIEGEALFDVRRLLAFDVQARRRLKADINIFRKAFNAIPSLGERRAALHLKVKVVLLQAPKAMHDPVVFLDDGGAEFLLSAEGLKQGLGLRQLVDKLRHLLLEGPRAPPVVRIGREGPARLAG